MDFARPVDPVCEEEAGWPADCIVASKAAQTRISGPERWRILGTRICALRVWDCRSSGSSKRDESEPGFTHRQECASWGLPSNGPEALIESEKTRREEPGFQGFCVGPDILDRTLKMLDRIPNCSRAQKVSAEPGFLTDKCAEKTPACAAIHPPADSRPEPHHGWRARRVGSSLRADYGGMH
jgi:hypothetical protein